jgi:hypothetical protein
MAIGVYISVRVVVRISITVEAVQVFRINAREAS